MGRIRTIKPEFPQSESIGKVSRDARLLFILLWTLCDDSGRTRAASRMLASLLYPYDDDAPSLIEGWLGELEAQECIVRYEVHGHAYLHVCKWGEHQKIDKPSRPKFPGPEEAREGSRGLGEASRKVALDQGPRTKDQGGLVVLGLPSEDGVPKRTVLQYPAETAGEQAAADSFSEGLAAIGRSGNGQHG